MKNQYVESPEEKRARLVRRSQRRLNLISALLLAALLGLLFARDCVLAGPAPLTPEERSLERLRMMVDRAWGGDCPEKPDDALVEQADGWTWKRTCPTDGGLLTLTMTQTDSLLRIAEAVR